MKKIFVYNGSPRIKNESNTSKIVDILLKGLAEKMEVETKVYTARGLNVKTCCGCTMCMKTWGECRMFNDDLNEMIKEMEKSDLIILASPVFVHNIPADMKNFLDRLAVWTHLLKMKGKLGIVVTTSGSNGNQTVSDYLTLIMEFWGIPVVGKLDYQLIQTEKDFEENLDKCLADTIHAFSNVNKLNFFNLEFAYHTFKQHYENMGKQNPEHVEYKYWKENKYFEAKSYKEIFLKNFNVS